MKKEISIKHQKEIPAKEIKKSTNESEMYVWGNDSEGQLGTSDYSFSSNYINPRLMKYKVNIKKISCGFQHTILLSEMGNVYGLGSNKFGQIGLGKMKKRTKPAMLSLCKKEKIWKITSGGYHTLIATNKKNVYSFGKNHKGQLGHGDYIDKLFPKKIEYFKNFNVYYLNAGKNHSSLIDTEHSLYLWGCNKYGQLGLGLDDLSLSQPLKFITDIKPNKISCGYKNTLLLTENFEVYATGLNDIQQVEESKKMLINEFEIIYDLVNIEKVYCSDFFMVLTRDFNCYVWGGVENSFCPFSKPTLLAEFQQRVLYASIGEGFIVLVDTDLLVYSCGKNNYGQLGYGDTVQENVFGCIEKICQNPLKDIQCGRDFVLGLGGILTINPNKKYQMECSGYNNNNDGVEMMKSENYSQSQFNYGNVNGNFDKKLEHQQYRYKNVDDVKSLDGNVNKSMVSNAVKGFKNQVYDLLKDITDKNPGIENNINRNIIDKLQNKEKFLDGVLQEEEEKNNNNDGRHMNKNNFEYQRDSHYSDDDEQRIEALNILDVLEKNFYDKFGSDAQSKKMRVLISNMEGFLRFDGSDLIFLKKTSKIIKKNISRYIRKIDKILESQFSDDETDNEESEDSKEYERVDVYTDKE